MFLSKLKTLFRMVLVYENWYELFLARYGLLGNGLATCKTRDGIRIIFRKKTNDHSILNDIFVRKTYDKFYPIKNEFTVIDIGAQIGTFSVYAAAKGANVYSYEPEIRNFKLLNKNIGFNSLKNKIRQFGMAVGGDGGYTNLFISKGDVGGHTIVKAATKSNTQRVRKITLADIFISNKIERCDFLKMDCEGSEYDILFKAPNSILRKIKSIAMEYHETEKHNYHEMEEFLIRHGFETKLTKPSRFGVGLLYAIRTG